MRPSVVSQTGTGQTNPIGLNYQITPFNATLAVAVTGTVTYQVEATVTDLTTAGYTAGSDVWFIHSTLVGKTDNQVSNYAFPVTAVRLNVTAGTGTAKLTVIQAGTAN